MYQLSHSKETKNMAIAYAIVGSGDKFRAEAIGTSTLQAWIAGGTDPFFG